MCDTVQNIVIGATGSIIATALIYILSKLYNFNSSKQRMYNLETALNCVYQIENMRNFTDNYDLIIHDLECIHRHVFEVHKSIYPLTMFFYHKKKRLIQTLLYDITRRCELCLFSTVGYDGPKEKQARLEQIQKYFYSAESKNYNCSIVRFSLSLIKLLSNMSISKAFTNKNMLPYSFADFDTLIEINSFKYTSKKEQTKITNNFIQDKGLTRYEYNKIVQRVRKTANGVHI